MKIIKKHPIYSEELLLKQDSLSKCAAIVKYHHEKWDDSGCPEGIKGDGIPYLARILSIVDVYDALTTDQPYREKNFTQEEALEIILKGRSKQFDPN
ncbi:HD domain-containing protein [Alkaliphilus sp. MSJ-5]|uniref:HD domain-containing protein n=1 Tax=Alkaliphilus flagellatus TaxID=2841507 RepID=A0ABS6G218_9FIRM|nr:HD domain-containing phosphohydrolase [Alkaliphilus flagellatus]MBU5675767.1 HD domain-containing protein [Alkaliphilus flagellatus]